jgi:hypothetical protein
MYTRVSKCKNDKIKEKVVKVQHFLKKKLTTNPYLTLPIRALMS